MRGPRLNEIGADQLTGANVMDTKRRQKMGAQPKVQLCCRYRPHFYSGWSCTVVLDQHLLQMVKSPGNNVGQCHWGKSHKSTYLVIIQAPCHFQMKSQIFSEGFLYNADFWCWVDLSEERVLLVLAFELQMTSHFRLLNPTTSSATI